MRRWRQQSSAHPRWPEAAHDALEVAHVQHGAINYRVGSRRLKVLAGQVAIIPIGVGHLTRLAKGTRCTSVWVSPPLVSELGEALGRADAGSLEPAVMPNGRKSAALIQLLVEQAQRPKHESLLAADALAEALTIRLLQRREPAAERAAGSDPRIARAVEHLESCYAEPLTVDALARTAGMSRYHFSRRFRVHTGHAPYQYLTATRIRRAAELLRRGRHSVTYAAISVGFSDLGRFANAFRKQLGCAPSDFRTSTARIADRRAQTDAP